MSQPITVPASSRQRPRLMWLVLALAAALVSLLVARNIVQASAIGSHLAGSGPRLSEAAGMTAESAGWIIDTSFVVATALVAIALYAFTGSRIGRAVFTAFLAVGAFLGIWNTVNPRSAALGGGELILASAHPAFASLTSLALALVSASLIVLLYRPQVNEYFLADSPEAPASWRDRDHVEPHLPHWSDLDNAGPVAMPGRASSRPVTRDERVGETTTTTTIPPLPTPRPSPEKPIAPAI